MRFLAGPNLSCYWIVRVTVVVRVNPPPIPVMVSVELPGFVVGFVFTVSVVPVVELVGLNVALAFAGSPVTENVTALLNPLVGLTEIA